MVGWSFVTRTLLASSQAILAQTPEFLVCNDDRFYLAERLHVQQIIAGADPREMGREGRAPGQDVAGILLLL